MSADLMLTRFASQSKSLAEHELPVTGLLVTPDVSARVRKLRLPDLHADCVAVYFTPKIKTTVRTVMP